MKHRLTRLRRLLAEQKITALLVTNPLNITYLTGLPNLNPSEPELTLIITPTKAYLLASCLRAPALKKLPLFTLVELKRGSDLHLKIKAIVRKHRLQSLAFEATNLAVAEHHRLKKLTHLQPTKGLLEQLRLIKDQNEIKAISQACRLANQAMGYARRIIKPGVTEQKIAWQIEQFMRQKGAQAVAFPLIVASGPNSAIPHHTVSNRQIKKTDVVLIDIGCKINGYCSDMTRTIKLGPTSSEFKQVKSIVQAAYQKALVACHQPPVTCASVDSAARKIITSAGFAKHFPHGLGHGLGLNIHEAPSLSPNSPDKLKPNIVFTIEPAIYLEGKFGYRHEDTILLSPSGPQALTS
jgi:Xaa-Pro aminopeptidase